MRNSINRLGLVIPTGFLLKKRMVDDLPTCVYVDASDPPCSVDYLSSRTCCPPSPRHNQALPSTTTVTHPLPPRASPLPLPRTPGVTSAPVGRRQGGRPQTSGVMI